MSTIYLTGTRTPGGALQRFIPDFVETLLDEGHHLITSNKRGVDEAVINHCEQHDLPLKVCAFLADHNLYNNRHVQVASEQVQVQKIYSPTWQRFRHLAEMTEKMVFLHAGKTRGRLKSMPTSDAFAAACAKRGVAAEQFIVQHQQKAWVSVTELRTSPTVGTAHLYLYPRIVGGIDGKNHCVGHYRLETWRKIGNIIQPGIGRREFVLPRTTRQEAALQLLCHALQEIQLTVHPRLVIYYEIPRLPELPFRAGEYQSLRNRSRALLSLFPQVRWQHEKQADLLIAIGAHIQDQNALWYHDKAIAATKGLYQ